jgi:hypothetical protein
MEVAPGNGRGSAHGRGSDADTSGRRAADEAGEAEHVPEEEDEGRRSEGPYWYLQKSQELHCKLNFRTDPKL